MTPNDSPYEAWKQQPISTIMAKDPKCLRKDHTVGDALLLMDARHADHIPITEDGKPGSKLIGIMSRQDVDREISEETADASHDVESLMMDYDFDLSNQSTRDVLHVLVETDPLEKAVEYLSKKYSPPNRDDAEHGDVYLTAIPVIDTQNKKLLAIVSNRDILTSINNGKIPLADIKVEEIMTPRENLITVSEETHNISDLYFIMRSKGVRTLPVTKKKSVESEVEGLVTETSVFRLFQKAVRDDLRSIKANDPQIMTDIRFLDVLSPKDSVKDITHYFTRRTHPIALMVVDPKGKHLLGILSYVDILRKL